MRVRALRSTLCLLVAGFVCGSFSAAAAGGKHTFVYVHNNATQNAVYGFELSKDGSFTALGGSPFVSSNSSGSCGGFCMTSAYSKRRKALVTSGGQGIVVWLVSKDGTLTQVGGSPFGGQRILGVAVIERGKQVFVYGSAFSDDQIAGFSMAKDGTLTALASFPVSAGHNPDGMDAAKGKLFVANEDNTVSAFTVGKDGALTEPAASPWAVPAAFIYNLQADPRGKFVLIGDDDPRVFVYAVDRKTAALTSVTGSPFDAGQSVSTGLSVHKKRFAYTFSTGSGDGTNDIRAFKIEKDGTLTARGALQSSGLNSVDAHALTGTGKILVVANSGGVLASLAVDTRTGALTPLSRLDAAGFNKINDLETVTR